MTKNIIFYCYGGAHSSVVTASIYLGLLNPDKIPSTSDLLLLPFFDQQIDQDHGKMRLMGQDNAGNNVYIVGKRSMGDSFINVIQDFLSIRGVETKPVMINTLPGVNFYMRIGGFLSRKLRITALGRPIVIWGTKKAYRNFVQIAKEQKIN